MRIAGRRQPVGLGCMVFTGARPDRVPCWAFAILVALGVFRGNLEIVSDCKKGWSMRRSVSGLVAKPALLPGTPTFGPGVEMPWARGVFAGCSCDGSHPTRRRGRTAFPLATEPGTTTRTGCPTPRQSALGPRRAKGSSMTGGLGSCVRSRASSSIFTASQATDPPRRRTSPRTGRAWAEAGTGPRFAPGSATSLPWSAGNGPGVGPSPYVSLRMGRRGSGASLASGSQTKRGLGTA